MTTSDHRSEPSVAAAPDAVPPDVVAPEVVAPGIAPPGSASPEPALPPPPPDVRPDAQHAPPPWSAPGPQPTWTAAGQPPPTWPDALGPFPSPPPPAPSRPRIRVRPRWGCGDIAIGIALTFAAGIVFSIPLVLGGVSESSLLYQLFSAGSVWASLGGWALYTSWVKGLGSLKLDFHWAFRWYDPFLGVAMAFLTLLLAGGLEIVQNQIGVDQASNTGFLQDAADGRGLTWTYVGLILIVGVGAPIVEELFFRGLTFTALERRYNGLVAVVGSSLIFGALHYQPGPAVSTIFFLVTITIFGLVLGTARFLTKRTGPGVFAHMSFNLFAALSIVFAAVVR